MLVFAKTVWFQTVFALASLISVLSALALASLLPACSDEESSSGDGGQGGQGGAGTGTTAPETDSSEYLLDSSEGFEPVDATTVRLSLQDGQLGFSAGCNSHSGEYSIEDGILVVDGMGSTTMGCDAARSQQDAFLAEFFTSRPSYEEAGDRLTLTGSDATLVFLDKEVATPDQELAGPTWKIDTLIDGETAMGGFAETGTVEFSKGGGLFPSGGTFTVDTTCNIGEGSYEVDGSALVFGEVSFTEKACSDPSQANYEAHLITVFSQGAASWETDANRLTIEHGDAGIMALTE